MKKSISFILLIITHNLIFSQRATYDSLIFQLQTIERNDQVPRLQLDSIVGKYSGDSLEMMRMLKMNREIMRYNDSVDLVKMSAILDKYGWLGPDEIGDDACQTLFIVIQHASLQTQEKYFPVMQAAVINGKAKPSQLAYLEDRMALRKRGKQIYGTQVFFNMKTKVAYILPIEDPYNLDIRRGRVGLQTMTKYLEDSFGKKWDMSEYFRDLPTADSLMRASHYMK